MLDRINSFYSQKEQSSILLLPVKNLQKKLVCHIRKLIKLSGREDMPRVGFRGSCGSYWFKRATKGTYINLLAIFVYVFRFTNLAYNFAILKIKAKRAPSTFGTSNNSIKVCPLKQGLPKTKRIRIWLKSNVPRKWTVCPLKLNRKLGFI